LVGGRSSSLCLESCPSLVRACDENADAEIEGIERTKREIQAVEGRYTYTKSKQRQKNDRTTVLVSSAVL